jgi:hypothetical protein
MARYDIKFGGMAGSTRMFGEVAIDTTATLDEAMINSLRDKIVGAVADLLAHGMKLDPRTETSFGDALAPRVAALVPGGGATCRVTSLRAT